MNVAQGPRNSISTLTIDCPINIEPLVVMAYRSHLAMFLQMDGLDKLPIPITTRPETFEMKSQPVSALDVLEQRKTIYPMPFALQVAGRVKRRLGDHFGLKNFGVNLTELAPGAVSSLLHSHMLQDEFVYVLEGNCIARVGDSEHHLRAGDCLGFPAGTGLAHQLVNRSTAKVRYLEIGDRTAGESVEYPQDDLAFAKAADGQMVLVRKDGTPY